MLYISSLDLFLQHNGNFLPFDQNLPIHCLELLRKVLHSEGQFCALVSHLDLYINAKELIYLKIQKGRTKSEMSSYSIYPRNEKEVGNQLRYVSQESSRNGLFQGRGNFCSASLKHTTVLRNHWRIETSIQSNLLKVRYQQPKYNFEVQLCDRNHAIKLYRIISKDELQKVRLSIRLPFQHKTQCLPFGRGRLESPVLCIARGLWNTGLGAGGLAGSLFSRQSVAKQPLPVENSDLFTPQSWICFYSSTWSLRQKALLSSHLDGSGQSLHFHIYCSNQSSSSYLCCFCCYCHLDISGILGFL